MSEKRRRFSASFKAEVALEAIRCKSTVNEIASQHAVHPNQVVAWKKQAVESLRSLTGASVRERKRKSPIACTNRSVGSRWKLTG